MPDIWYRNAVVYSLDVEVFFDSNGDGIGDFAGLIEKLDHLVDLGVTCLWLQPFYPTPNHDDGYDVSDYYSVDPRLGSIDDFRHFIEEATRRDIRVLVDLVVNHTSVEHPWFRAAQRDRTSKYRDYYIWHDAPPENERRGGLVFPGEQVSNWAHDEVSDSYYWHWFYDQQPDLNTGNPAVREEIKRIIAYWLDLGVSGFRIDAAPFLFKRKGLEGSYPDDPLGFLVELRQFLVSRRPDAVFLAEADVATDELTFFLGEGERMHLLFNFILNNYFFLALAREDSRPLRNALEMLPQLPAGCQWANFLRNHDELNLDRLEPEERDFVFQRFAPDPSSRIYGRGIRRRLPPLLRGDRRHLELAYSLLFSLPGTPVIRYGQELGMGDDLELPGRLAVRTPMQWSGAENGGFSQAAPERLVRPIVRGGDFGFERVNVEQQRRDADSMMSFTRRLVRDRLACPEIGDGELRLLQTGDAAVFAHACVTTESAIICVHNLSNARVVTHVDLGDLAAGRMTEIRGDRGGVGPDGKVTLEGYGHAWTRVS